MLSSIVAVVGAHVIDVVDAAVITGKRILRSLLRGLWLSAALATLVSLLLVLLLLT